MSEQQIAFDTDNLYRIDTYTDQKTGSIRRMTPVDAEGNDDPSREVRYIGEASAMTPAGSLPLNFELEGENLAEAASGFGEAAEKALSETIEELKRMQREQQDRIMVPGQEEAGSKIQVPGAGGKMKF